jgi:hypothetical protein
VAMVVVVNSRSPLMNDDKINEEKGGGREES